MKYNKVVRDGKPSEAVVIRCIDPDFQGAFEEVSRALVKGKIDPLSAAGPDFSVAFEEYPLEQIETAYKLHKISRVIILAHINCKKLDIHDETDELEKHKELLASGTERVNKAFPELQVEGYVLGWDSIMYSTVDEV